MSGTTASLSGPFELSNLTAPASGVTKALIFTVNTPGGGGTATVTLAAYMQQLGSFRPQAATIDNTANNTPVTVTEQNFGWKRVVNAGQYMTFNYPAVQFPIFLISATVGQTVSVTLYDFPVFPETSFNYAVGQAAQNVTVTNTPLPVSFPSPYGVNNNAYSVNLSGSAVSTTLAVGTAGLTTYLLGYEFTTSNELSVAVAGINLFTLSAGATAIGKYNMTIQTSAGPELAYTLEGRASFQFPCLLSLGIQPTLSVASTQALVTGAYNVNFFLVDM